MSNGRVRAEVKKKTISAARRDEIIEAARRILSNKGMRGLTVRNVAAEAGVSSGLITYYFDGVNGLLDAVFDSIMFELPHAKEFEPSCIGEAVDNLLLVVERYFDPLYYSRSSLLVWLPVFEAMLLDKTFRKKIFVRDEEYIREFSVHIEQVMKFRHLELNAVELARNLMSFMDGLWLRWCHSDRPDTRSEQSAAVEYLEFKLGPLRRVHLQET